MSITCADSVGRTVFVAGANEAAGAHERSLNAAAWAAGVYTCRLDADGASATRTLTLLP